MQFLILLSSKNKSMKSLLLSWVFLFISYTVFCMPIQGKVKVGEKGLSQIIITDGYQ